jgi:hypothetical protein
VPFLQRTLIAAVAMVATALSTGAAMAHGYNGNTMFVPESRSYTGAWPVTVSRSQFSNGTYCLTLTQNGSNGGSASLVFGNERYPYGSFIIFNDVLVAILTEPLYGQNGAIMFSAPAARGHIGQGAFENIEGGSNFDAGASAFGTKGGC